jgi:hypothetical protein
VRLRLVNIVAILLAFSGWSVSRAQTVKAISETVVYNLAAGIAQEVLDKIESSFPDSGQVAVRVEGHTNRTTIENAFAEVLSRSRLKPVLGMDALPGGAAIDVLVLGQSVDYRQISSQEFVRTVATNLEVRFQPERSTSAQYLGRFERTSMDTVARRSDMQLFGGGEEHVPDDTSLFDRIAAPVLIITGAFLIVYLFFTVRN